MRFTDLRALLARARHASGAAALTSPVAPLPELELAGHADAPAALPAAPVALASPWPLPRQQITDALWGEGCVAPGGSEEALRLTAPLGLSSAASLLLVGVGPGGGALRIAAETGAWVTACESDPALVAAATNRVHHAGAPLSKRVTVETWNPRAPDFRKGRFNHALAIECLHGGSRTAMLTALVRGLRPGGQLVLQETVAGPAFAPQDPALLAWCRLEHRPPPLASHDWLPDTLQRLKCDVRVTEDATARHMLQAVSGWKHLVRDLRHNRPPPARAALVVAEAELWLRRIALLRGGQLRFMRWHAIAP